MSDCLTDKRRSKREKFYSQQKATDAESELQCIKLSVIKSKEEKLEIETRARETEHMVSRLVEESERRRQEADDLKREVDIAR